MRGRNRERRSRGRPEELRKQIGQLKKYIRQLEGQIGLEIPPPPQEPAEPLEEAKPAERCPSCKSLNVTVMETFKVKIPIKIYHCRDCEDKIVVEQKPCP